MTSPVTTGSRHLHRLLTLGVAGLAGLLTLSACGSSGGGAGTTPTPRPTASSTSATPSPSPSTSKAPSPAQVRAAASKAIAAQRTHGVQVSAAALNTATGAKYDYGATSGLWTASVYKLLVLETLVLQHQEAGTTLSGSEASAATTMIENSDDPAGYQLFLALGGRPGLTTGIRRLGLTHTVAGRSDPTFTTTGAADCLVLLRNLVQAKSPLDSRSRAYIVGLMRQVESDQRWGVGVVADHGTTFANKNGWLSVDDTNGPGEDDNGLWITNSVGIVTVRGQQVLMAVLTEHNANYPTGIARVQAIAKAAVQPVTTAG